MARARAFLISIFFAGLLGAGLGLSVAGLHEARSRWTSLDWVGGAMGREIETVLSKASAWSEPLQRGSRWLGWHLMGDLGPEVRAGCPGWLFYREEFHAPDWPALEWRLDAAARIQARLAGRGIAMLLLPVADKARVESAHLCGLKRHPELEQRLTRIQSGLARRGVAMVAPDWSHPATETRYFRTDTHWNPTGSRLAARAVADWVHARRPDLARPPLPSRPLVENEPVPGDLLKLTRLDAWPRLLPPEFTPAWSIPVPSPPGSGLLDEPAPPALLLVGSSYSRNARFSDFLAAELGQALALVARDGAGFHGGLAEALANPMMAESPPRLLVWEFPERVMTVPLSPAERDALARLAGLPESASGPVTFRYNRIHP